MGEDTAERENRMYMAQRAARVMIDSAENAESVVADKEEEMKSLRANMEAALLQQQCDLRDLDRAATAAVEQAVADKNEQMQELRRQVADAEQRAAAIEELAVTAAQDSSKTKLAVAERIRSAEEAKEEEVKAQEARAADIEKVARSSFHCVQDAESVLRDYFGCSLETRRSLPPSLERNSDEAMSPPKTGLMSFHVKRSVGDHAQEMQPAKEQGKGSRTFAVGEPNGHNTENHLPVESVGWGSLRESVKTALYAKTTPLPKARQRRFMVDVTPIGLHSTVR